MVTNMDLLPFRELAPHVPLRCGGLHADPYYFGRAQVLRHMIATFLSFLPEQPRRRMTTFLLGLPATSKVAPSIAAHFAVFLPIFAMFCGSTFYVWKSLLLRYGVP